MRYIKYFESLYKPKVGEYVIVKNLGLGSSASLKDFEEFVKNNVGIVTFISNDPIFYEIKYYNVPKELRGKFRYDLKNQNLGYKTTIYDLDDSREKIRLATPEESEEFDIKIKMEKFNI